MEEAYKAVLKAQKVPLPPSFEYEFDGLLSQIFELQQQLRGW